MILGGLKRQDGFLAGRVARSHDRKWLAQGFYDATGVPDGWLPDGMRRVVVRDSDLAAWRRGTRGCERVRLLQAKGRR